MLVASYALQAAALGLSAAASPGPFQAYLIAQSLKLGWKRALPAAFAPLISDGPILVLVLFLLTRLPPAFLRVLQIAGGFFILYLAWKSWQAFRNFQEKKVIQAGEERQNIFQAALMNFLNPNPYIFWSVAAGPALISRWNLHPANGIAFLLGFYTVMIAGSALLIVLFASAGNIGPRVNRALLGLSSAALLVFGLYQLWRGVFQ